MSKFTEGLALLQEDFKERFGVDVEIWARVHSIRRGNIGVVTKYLAEEITTTLKNEIGGDQKHNQSVDGGCVWADLMHEADNGVRTEVTVFYPAEEGATV